jgi:pimeloyl-ACP methyl ester carboxylesterase
MSTSQNLTVNWTNVPTRTITAGGVEFAYRELGTNNPGMPVVFLIHLAAVLDNWDPRVVDGLAASRHVVTFDNRGVGASSGAPATSMGGMIAQDIVLMEPQLVRKMILAGTGPAGGEGISKVARVTYLDMVRGFLTHQDQKQFLFFTRTPRGIRAGKDFLPRLNERAQNRDKAITVTALQAQLKALRRWGSKKPADLSKIQQPVLVANGDSDRMVPTKNTHDLARRLPNSDLIIYPDAGHGAVFQFHADFVPKALEFLAR